MINDSGNRREFESGAVRDMAEGKGRCDLMPLPDVAAIFEFEDGSAFMGKHRKEIANCFRALSICVDEKESREDRYLAAKMAIYYFRHLADLSVPDMMLEVAVHYEEGAKKYGEHNWEKGLPLWCFIDSATRHFLKYLGGRTDERHDRAFVWNMLGFMYTIRHSDMSEGASKEEICT